MNPSAVTYHLRTLGRLELTRADGTSVDSVLSQPKRLALLVYLIVASRGGLCRRDTVLGVFWPEFDQERARAALRKALHFLRRKLDDGVIIARGDEEIGVDATQLSCDVSDFHSALESGEVETALGVYAGDFLSGFYVSDALEFERWTEATRLELVGDAARVAGQLTQRALNAADVQLAVQCARRWVRLARHDEAAARAVMSALHDAGERAEALDEYAAFVSRLRALDVEPSAETRALESTIRRQSDPLDSAPEADDPSAAAPPRHSSWRGPVAVAGAAVGIGLIVVSLAMLAPPVASDPPTVEVRVLTNMTGDSMLLAVGAVYQRAILDGVTAMGLKAAAPGHEETPAFTIDGSYHRRGDSLEITLTIEDRERDRLLPAPNPARAPLTDPVAALERVRDRAVGALGYYTSYWAPSSPAHRPPDYDVYLAFQEALQTVLRWSDWDEPRRARADTLLHLVLERDPGYTEAYLLLGGFIFANTGGPATSQGQPGNIGNYLLMDSLVRDMQGKLRPMTEKNQLAIDYLSAVVDGDYASALDALLRLTPTYPELTFRVAAEAVKANAPSRAIEAIRQLEPETAWVREFWSYWYFLTAAYHELGDYEGEADVVRDWANALPPAFTEPQARVHIATANIEGVRESTREPYGNLALRQGLEARAHGLMLDNPDLLAESQRLLGWWEDRYDEQPGVWYHRQVAYWVLPITSPSRIEEVISNLEVMARDSVDRWDVKGKLGAAYARVGRSAAADSIDAILAAGDPTHLRGLLSLWRARIAAQSGERDKAVRLLGQALLEGTFVHPAFPGWSSFWHTDPDFEPLRGYEPYERLVAAK